MFIINSYRDFLNFLINLFMPLTNHIDKAILYSVVLVVILSFIPKIDYIVDKFSKYFMVISVISLIILTLLVSYDVIMRKIFSGGSIALQELEWHLYDIIFLFGIAYTLSKDKHVRVDIFYDRFPFKLKKIINIFSLIVFIIPLSTLIIVEAIPFIQMSIAQNECSGNPGGLPYRWIIKSSMFWAFLIVLLQSSGEIRKNFYMLIKGSEK